MNFCVIGIEKGIENALPFGTYLIVLPKCATGPGFRLLWPPEKFSHSTSRAWNSRISLIPECEAQGSPPAHSTPIPPLHPEDCVLWAHLGVGAPVVFFARSSDQASCHAFKKG